MIETSVLKCKQCQADKTRTQDGKFDGVNKRWRDDDGGLWNGRVCSSCHRDNVRLRKKAKALEPAVLSQ